MIIIVGASHGLGLELVKKFTQSRNKVICISRTTNAIYDNELIKHINLDLNSRDFSQLDTIKENSIKSVIFTIGYYKDDDDFNLSYDEIDKILDLNFTSLTKFLHYLVSSNKLEKKSYISFCSSVTTFMPRDNQIFYSASKLALDNYINSLRIYFLNKNQDLKINKFIIGVLDEPMQGSKSKPSRILAHKTSKAAETLFNNHMKNNIDKSVPMWWNLIYLILKVVPFTMFSKIIKISRTFKLIR